MTPLFDHDYAAIAERMIDLAGEVGFFMAGFFLANAPGPPPGEEVDSSDDYQAAMTNDEDFWRGFLEAKAQMALLNPTGASNAPRGEPSLRVVARPEVLAAFVKHLTELDEGLTERDLWLALDGPEIDGLKSQAAAGEIRSRGLSARKVARLVWRDASDEAGLSPRLRPLIGRFVRWSDRRTKKQRDRDAAAGGRRG